MNMKKWLMLVMFLVMACGPKKPTKPSVDKLQLLADKTVKYEELFLSQQDQFGFIEYNRCDSLIFTGISNKNANLTAAEIEPGRWIRRPAAYSECFASGMSRSEVSRDGLIGVMFWAVENKDTDTLLRLWRYGTDNNWIMAKGGWEHSVMAPPHIALLAQAIYYTSDGARDYAIRHTRTPMLSAGEGFEGHLQVLQFLLQKKVYGSTIATDKSIMKQLGEQRPNNPLMLYMMGDIDGATNILLEKFPQDRLPTSNDWCTTWINEQAYDGNGLKPCPEENSTHSGGDFLFTARMILGTNK